MIIDLIIFKIHQTFVVNCQDPHLRKMVLIHPKIAAIRMHVILHVHVLSWSNVCYYKT